MDAWRSILATQSCAVLCAHAHCFSLLLGHELGSSSAGAAWGSALSFSPDSLANELSSCKSILRFSNNRKRRAACPGVRPHAGRGVSASNFEEHQSRDQPQSQRALPLASALLPPALLFHLLPEQPKGLQPGFALQEQTAWGTGLQVMKSGR